jgi:HEAT repeat protein
MLTPDWYTRLMFVAAVVYVASAIGIIAQRIRYDRRRAVVKRIQDRVASGQGGRPAAVALSTAFSDLSLRTLAKCLYDLEASNNVLAACAHEIIRRLGEPRVVDQAGRAWSRWRRVAAFRALAFAEHESAWPILSRAITDGSSGIRTAAVATLGRLADPRSAVLLVQALRRGQEGRAHIASLLNAFPVPIDALIVPLLEAADSISRYWGTVLMARYGTQPEVESRLRDLTWDRDPSVRKAALVSLGEAGCRGSLDVILRLMRDEVPFVRAHAVHAIGALGLVEFSRDVAAKLADQDWSTRDAAKRVLEGFGTAAEPAVLDMLDSDDLFARNGAAEILQNVGSFERLLTLEAIGPSDPRRVIQIRRIAVAGGLDLWQAVVSNLPLELRPRVVPLLEHATAASGQPGGTR